MPDISLFAKVTVLLLLTALPIESSKISTGQMEEHAIYVQVDNSVLPWWLGNLWLKGFGGSGPMDDAARLLWLLPQHP